MPTKNIYVSDADLSTWEEAQARLKGSISSLVINCIRRKLEKMKIETGELEKIVVKMSERGGKASFLGTWLVHPNEELKAEPDNNGISWDAKTVYALARTSKGRLAVLQYGDDDIPEYKHYDDFEDVKSAQIDNGRYPAYPDNVLGIFAEALNEDYEIELDI